MQLYYFMSADGRQLGPIPGEQLINCGITPDTLVWGQNMSGWAPANTVPEIVELFTSQTQPAQSQSSVKAFYYIGKDGLKLGPSSAEEAMNYGITPQTKVWCEGMTDWEDAGSIPEFKVLFDKTSVSDLFRVLPDGSVEMINALDTLPSTENTPITAKSLPDPKQPFEPQSPELEPESEYESENKKGGVIWRVILIIAAILLALGIAYFLFNSNKGPSKMLPGGIDYEDGEVAVDSLDAVILCDSASTEEFITTENSNESISVKDENVTEGIKSADEEKDASTAPGSTDLKNRVEVLVVEKIIEEDNQVLTSDVQIPQFPGGDDELVRWISTHIKYQDSAVNDNPQGSIFVELGVAMDGSINLVKVLHSPFSNFEGSLKSRDYLEHVVMSAVGKLPNFIPGNINCQYFIEVKIDFT